MKLAHVKDDGQLSARRPLVPLASARQATYIMRCRQQIIGPAEMQTLPSMPIRADSEHGTSKHSSTAAQYKQLSDSATGSSATDSVTLQHCNTVRQVVSQPPPTPSQASKRRSTRWQERCDVQAGMCWRCSRARTRFIFSSGRAVSGRRAADRLRGRAVDPPSRRTVSWQNAAGQPALLLRWAGREA